MVFRRTASTISATGVTAVTAQTRIRRTSWLVLTCQASRINCPTTAINKTVTLRYRLRTVSMNCGPQQEPTTPNLAGIPWKILIDGDPPEKAEIGKHFAG